MRPERRVYLYLKIKHNFGIHHDPPQAETAPNRPALPPKNQHLLTEREGCFIPRQTQESIGWFLKKSSNFYKIFAPGNVVEKSPTT
jgi:hypothetical protein